MKLLGYEIVKFKKNTFLLALFSVFIVINGIFIFHQTNTIKNTSAPLSDIESVFTTYYHTPEAIHAGYNAYIETKKQNEKITEETIKSNTQPQYIPYAKTFSTDPNFPDSYFYNILFSEIDKISTYPETISSILNNAEKTISEYQNMGISEKSYAIQYQRKAIDSYTQTATSVHFGLEFIHGWDVLFSYKIDNILIFIFVIAISVFSFLYENETGMSHILRVSRFGRSRTATSKIISILICIVLVVFIFAIENCLIIGVTIGFSNPNNAIQIINDFRLCPIDFTILEYFFVSILFKISTYCLFSILIVLISLLTRNTLYTYISSILLYAINLLPEWIAQNNPSSFFKKINLISASSVSPLFDDFQTINLFGNAIECYLFTIYSILIFIPIIFSIIVFIYDSNLHLNIPNIKFDISAFIKPFSHSQHFTLPLPTIAKPCSSIYLWEIQKTIGKPSVIIIISGCILLKLITADNTFAPNFSYSETIYHNYMTVLAGKLSDEKKLYIAEERDDINHILLEYTQYQEDYSNCIISYPEYEAYLTLYSEAYEKNEPLSRIEQHLYYSTEQSRLNKDSWFVYDTGWYKLFTADFDWILFLLQLILFSNVFIIEYTSKSSNGSFNYILRTTKNGRHTSFSRKLLSTATLSFIFYTLFCLIDIYYISSNFDLPLAEAPLYSLSFMSESIIDISIGQYCVIFVLAKLLANIVFSLLIVSVSCFMRNYISTLTVIVFITLIPHLFSQTGFKYFSYIDYTLVLRFTPLILGNIPSILYALTGIISTIAVTIYAKKKWLY